MRPRVRTIAKLLLLALLLSVLVAYGQDYRIRAKVDLVVVPVTVKGPGDRLVNGLTKDDFIVFEDGRPQTITTFAIDPVPLSAAVVVQTGIQAGSLSKVQQTFTALAGAFSEFDEVAMYRYDKFVVKVLDFSPDLNVVESAMKTLRNIAPQSPSPAATAPGGPFSIVGPVINGAPVVQPGQAGTVTTAPRRNPQVLNDAIFTAASDLAKRERSRRKIVLIVSDGQEIGSDHGFDETAQTLLETGIQVYAIALDQPVLFRTLSTLGDYAAATGGDAFFVSSIQKIESAYSTATEEARNQYILGYISNNEPGGAGPVFRDIEVRMARNGLETSTEKAITNTPDLSRQITPAKF